MIHDSFVHLMESELLPLQAANPASIRLDGNRTGGNWEVAGRFRHGGKVWRIHADTHYEPLKLAYEASKRGEEPFVEDQTPHGTCLVLTATLAAKQQERFKYLYIYQEGQ